MEPVYIVKISNDHNIRFDLIQVNDPSYTLDQIVKESVFTLTNSGKGHQGLMLKALYNSGKFRYEQSYLDNNTQLSELNGKKQIVNDKDILFFDLYLRDNKK